ncbi:MAG: PAS domain S-box protein, partial [Kofleriaceae bacterium]
MGSEDILRRENAELRAREVSYRDGWQRQLDLSTRLRQYAAQLRRSLHDEELRSTEAVFSQVAEISAEALGVARASVWLVDSGRQVLRCAYLFVRGPSSDQPAEIQLSGVQRYVRALTTDLLAVDDVTTDPRLLELTKYCADRRIGAMIDIPVVLDGEVVGVICHEHVGSPRNWLDAEIDFAANLGSVVALAIEAERRQEAQQRVREVDARYRHLVETVPVVIYSFDVATGKLAYVSPTIAALSGRAAEDWLALGIDGWIEQIVPEDRRGVHERMRIGIAGAFEPQIEYRIVRRDGAVVWVRDLCAVVRDAAGRPLAVQGTLEDITIERAAEQRRLEAERRYRQLIDHVDLLGLVVDNHGRVEFANAALCRVLGVTPDELIGTDGFGAFVPESDLPRVRAVHQRAVASGEAPVRVECPLRTREGELRQIVWTNTLLYDERGAVSGTASLGLDVTERNQLEAELAQQRKFESLGRMAASVAHDFNNVLTVLSLALAHGGKREEIATSMALASELVSSLLAYARRDPVAVADVDVDHAISELTPVLATAIGKDLRLDLDLHAAGRLVRISPTELRQLVLNLVTNAGEATRDHGRMVRISTDVIVRDGHRAPPERFVEIRIADDGRGMDAAARARAFDPFFTTKPDGRGGIGLATCHSIVTRANGTISIETEPGRGTTFAIVFPFATDPPAGVHAPSRGAVPVEERRVLLVEDSAMIGELVGGVLRDAGYDVVQAATVEHALAQIRGAVFGVVITDLQLSHGRGEDLVAAARARRPPPAIHGTTGEATLVNSVDGVFTKPV